VSGSPLSTATSSFALLLKVILCGSSALEIFHFCYVWQIGPFEAICCGMDRPPFEAICCGVDWPPLRLFAVE
jgi:hypothetical protein